MEFSSFFLQPFFGKPVWIWALFLGLVGALMVIDLGILHRRRQEVSVRDSLRMCSFYMLLACLFGLWVWHAFGAESGANFYTGYFVELSLSMDNLFVMSLIFMHLGVPKAYQHRVLFWGILGVILLRGAMIGAGVMLIERFEWILVIFGAFLLFTGFRMLFSKDGDEEIDLENNPVLRFLRRHFKITSEIADEKFFVRKPDRNGRAVLYATPLFVALCLIEISDVVFAVDSIPAIFAITTDPYIIFTSNLFAILGLRSLYFALSAVIDRFEYMKYSLALILAFIGAKICLAELIHYELNPLVTCAATVGLLAGGAAFSAFMTRRSARAH